MPCQCCERTKVGQAYPSHDPLCLHCGARLIWRIQRLLQRPREERIARCRQALADWMEHGHSEAEIRRLAKAEKMPIEEMISCEGEGCAKKTECQRYKLRKSSDLVSRVLCSGGVYSWFVRVE